MVARRIDPNVEDHIINLLCWTLHVPKSNIHTFTHLRDDLNLDSIDRLLLIAALERQFGIYFSTEEADAIETVRDASFLIQKYLH